MNEDQPNLRGYIISTPNRFLEVNTRYDWNGTPDYPDVVCFDVDRPGISIIGVSIYCSPGKHKYQLEFHEVYYHFFFHMQSCNLAYSPGNFFSNVLWTLYEYLNGNAWSMQKVYSKQDILETTQLKSNFLGPFPSKWIFTNQYFDILTSFLRITFNLISSCIIAEDYPI